MSFNKAKKAHEKLMSERKEVNCNYDVNKALDIIYRYSQIDGEHHKEWVIDQVTRALTGDSYFEWVGKYKYDEETNEEYSWSEGIAP